MRVLKPSEEIQKAFFIHIKNTLQELPFLAGRKALYHIDTGLFADICHFFLRSLFYFSQMKNSLTFIIIFFLVASSFGQENESSSIDFKNKTRKNSFYVEGFGNGGLFSVNYDRVLFSKSEHILIGRIGSGILFNPLLLEFNYLYGKKHCLEQGIGAGFNFEGAWDMAYRLGYRYLGNKGLLIRAAPLIHFEPTVNPMNVSLWGGLSLGYLFYLVRQCNHCGHILKKFFLLSIILIVWCRKYAFE